MSIAPASFSGTWVTGHSLFSNVVTMLVMPLFEASFPSPGLSLGVDLEEIKGQRQELLPGDCFRV